MSVQFLKSAGLRFVTSQTDTPLKKKGKIPWYVYVIGAAIYTALAGWLFAESSPLAWICLISAPVGFFYAWRAWTQEQQGRGKV
jgi:4-hydroxybenzoate polyprenyltransferase